jgi:indolepyruvate ferredoxin oxidoreductase
VNELLGSLNAQNHVLAVNVAKVPEQIKGFGHVKERHIEAAMLQWQNNLDLFRKAI